MFLVRDMIEYIFKIVAKLEYRIFKVEAQAEDEAVICVTVT